MLTVEQLEENKQTFIKLTSSIERENADIEGLIEKLNKSDFFSAPASTKYHNAFAGGLCEHSLNVYSHLCGLIKLIYPDEKTCPYSSDTLKIVALFHDLSKMNFYKISEKNVKTEDNHWVKEPFICVRDVNERFLYGNHEQTSLYMLSTFIPLSLVEEISILHHHAGMSDDCAKDNISAIYNKYPLAVLLHLADMLATYISERC